MVEEFLDGNAITADTSAVKDNAADVSAAAAPAIEEKKEATAQADLPPNGNPLPEKYDIKVPDGFELNESLMAKYEPVAKELGLDNAKAQKMADLYASIKQDEIASQQAAFDKMQSDYIAQAKQDKEFGGKDFEANLGLANTAIAKFGGQDFARVLSETGVANHPEFVRFFYRIGKLVSEDTAATGAGSASSPKSAAEVIFNKSLNRGA